MSVLKLITVDKHGDRPEEFCYCGNQLAATSTIARALAEGVPFHSIMVWSKRGDTLVPQEFDAELVRMRPRYLITFEGE